MTATPAVRVAAPGPLATVQDLGRFGFQRYGVSTSGAADPRALRLGNVLLGNDENAAAIEVTLGGAEFEFMDHAMFALTGADLAPDLNGFPVPMWETVAAAPGDRLTLTAPRAGLRAYICLSGGVAVEPVLGSRSTYLPARLGGAGGRALAAGDKLPLGEGADPPEGRRLPPALIPEYPSRFAVRVVLGPQADQFTEEALAAFLGSAYTVSERSDRQGVRLEGPAIEAGPRGYDIVSDAVPTGAVQVPGDGKPIVLLADRQTTGGYPKIAVVATVDIPLLAQAAPGAVVRFERVSVEDAQSAARAEAAALRALRQPGAFAAARTLRYSLVVRGREFNIELPSTARRAAAGAWRGRVDVNGVPHGVETAADFP